MGLVSATQVPPPFKQTPEVRSDKEVMMRLMRLKHLPHMLSVYKRSHT